jgi:hypothetical protein
MNNRNVNCRTTIPALLMALAFTCLCSVTAQTGGRGVEGRGTEGGAIVGLWHVQLFLDPEHTMLFAETYKQWHRDGLEFESANLFPGALCVGTWKQMAHNMVNLYHVGWTYGANGTYRFVLTETDTVSPDGNSYDGTFEQTFYDTDGNQVGDPFMGYIRATRLPPQ